MHGCVPTTRHARHSKHICGGLGCTLSLKGVLHLHAYRHALCQCAHCTGVVHALFATYMGIVYHIYTPTDIHLWVYISAQGLGCSCMWFTNIYLLGLHPQISVCTCLQTHAQALCMYVRMRHSSLPALQIYTWRVYTNVQGSGMRKYTYIQCTYIRR